MGPSLGFVPDFFFFVVEAVETIMVCSRLHHLRFFLGYDLSCKLSGKVVFLCFLVFLFLFSIRLELQVIRKGCMLIYGEEVIANKLES